MELLPNYVVTNCPKVICLSVRIEAEKVKKILESAFSIGSSAISVLIFLFELR